MSSRLLEPTKKQRWLMDGLTAHLSAAFGLRRDLASSSVDAADAVFDADGALLHVGDHGDQLADLSTRLRRLVVHQRDACDAQALGDSDALDSWMSLFDGRYSIVDHFEERGRRLFLLYENPYAFRSPRALSVRQRDVVALAARGHDNATIGLTLGVATSTAASHLAEALPKLGISNRAELCRYLDWEKSAVRSYSTNAGEGLQILDVEMDSIDRSALTESENDVAERAARGESNEDIAKARGSRPRTVANQLASIYSKLGINSRRELASRLNGAGSAE